MGRLRNWYWKIDALGAGPDSYFCASFAGTCAADLALVVRRQPLRGYKHYRAAGRWCRIHHHPFVDGGDFDLYLDEQSYPTVVLNMEGEGPPRNVYYYQSISVCGHELMIERGLGGCGDGWVETSLLATLARAPRLNWVGWKVSYAGDGYDSGEAASGTTAAALLGYLRGE